MCPKRTTISAYRGIGVRFFISRNARPGTNFVSFPKLQYSGNCVVLDGLHLPNKINEILSHIHKGGPKHFGGHEYLLFFKFQIRKRLNLGN